MPGWQGGAILLLPVWHDKFVVYYSRESLARMAGMAGFGTIVARGLKNPKNPPRIPIIGTIIASRARTS